MSQAVFSPGNYHLWRIHQNDTIACKLEVVRYDK